MRPLDAPELLHVVGYVTGAGLYAMLLVMVVRSRGPAYRLALGTALLGLAWNLGELTAHILDAADLPGARDWMAGLSYAALGFLAAVVVHAAARRQEDDEGPHSPRTLTFVGETAYALAALAGLMQIFAVLTDRPLPWSAGLILLTAGLTLLAGILLTTRGDHANGRSAFWMVGLALFAVSALHLSSFHGVTENWLTELLGHHASIPLAFAILYQDYRFAFADVFLKRALSLLALVACVVTGWSLVAPSIARDTSVSPSIGALIAMWIATALLFPSLRRLIGVFVDRTLLQRANYHTTLDQLASSLQACDSEGAVLSQTCAALAPALSAATVTTRVDDGSVLGRHELLIQTAEAPRPVLSIGRLSGGRRFLSDDLIMLERVAHLAGRRIDTLRLNDERYERMLREREISALAAQAELRALRAQINPHFLFNALTTLGYLIQSAPSRAMDTLWRLTTLLRAVLRSEGAFTTLGHELELIECYLLIERERFEERLDARVDVAQALRHVQIPALVIQPLVENAIKHGIGGAKHGGYVVVTADVSDEETPVLQILVRNTGAPLGNGRPHAGNGIGLQNVCQRLRWHYGDAATLTVATCGDETVAAIRLPLHHHEEDWSHVLEQSRV